MKTRKKADQYWLLNLVTGAYPGRVGVRILKNMHPLEYAKTHREEILMVFSWQKITKEERDAYLSMEFYSPEVDGDVERVRGFTKVKGFEWSWH